MCDDEIDNETEDESEFKEEIESLKNSLKVEDSELLNECIEVLTKHLTNYTLRDCLAFLRLDVRTKVSHFNMDTLHKVAKYLQLSYLLNQENDLKILSRIKDSVNHSIDDKDEIEYVMDHYTYQISTLTDTLRGTYSKILASCNVYFISIFFTPIYILGSVYCQVHCVEHNNSKNATCGCSNSNEFWSFKVISFDDFDLNQNNVLSFEKRILFS